jgi:uncharacterized protein (DUF433 family)
MNRYRTKTKNNIIPENIIIKDPKIRSGKPTIKGTRITTSDIWNYTVEKIKEDYPQLTLEQIKAVFRYIFE